MDEDISLIQQYLSGYDDAIEKIVLKYQRQIYAFVYRMTGNMEEAKDLTQQTLIKAVNGLKDFRQESSFKTWLYQIAKNAGLNHIKQNRHEEVEVEDLFIADHKGALSKILEKEKQAYIRSSLNKLPGRQRLAVALRVYEGLSVNETALIMGCTEGAVKAHYHNGVKRLREILKEKGYEVSA